MDAWAHPQSLDDQLMAENPINVGKEPLKGIAKYEILAREFVVIRGGFQLAALAIEWKDGVAYRIGILFIVEISWVDLQNRVWTHVNLG